MKTTNRICILTMAVLSGALLFGCSGEDGATGAAGDPGANGTPGADCAVYEADGGYNVVCGKDTTYLAEGADGKDGTGCTVRTAASGEHSVVCGGKAVGEIPAISYPYKPDTGKMTDTRTDELNPKMTTYKTVTIGKKVWMAENLRWKVRGAWYLNDDTTNIARYGYLYEWHAAMGLDTAYKHLSAADSGKIDAKHRGICPKGWHLPDTADWRALVDFAQAESGNMYGLMAADSVGHDELDGVIDYHEVQDWGGQGTDRYGFHLLASEYATNSDPDPAGYRAEAYFWLPMESTTPIYAYVAGAYCSEGGPGYCYLGPNEGTFEKDRTYASVRCVQD